eukprot:CAMPEP_0184692072 /NCGR_PEP_ID=MMETSP0313-20130426/698_1 /TAXON_ID=2792 /ORGANISM="Porphyridium aerugineum, Strain SAG 1380-2" /LENGTH=840 /DNA_ID=CAMNT_0027149875 /DNA_START=157 /DNA_END=2679 /DNA_ORIENTATION=+
MLRGMRYPGQAANARHTNLLNMAPQGAAVGAINRRLIAERIGSNTGNINNDETLANIGGDGFTTSMTLNNVLKHIHDLQAKSASGKVELGLLPFSWLVKQAAETEVADQPPQDAVFEHVNVVGTALEENVELELGFDIVVLKGGWTELSLATSNIAVTTIDIVQVGGDENSNAVAPAVPPVSTSALPSSDPTAVAPTADPSQPLDTGVDMQDQPEQPCAYVAVSNGYYKLFNFGASKWRVKLTGMAPFSSNQNRNFSIWVPEAICTKLQFTVLKQDVVIKVENALEQKQETVTNQTGAEGSSKTTMTAILAPSSHVSLGWTDRVAEVPHMDDEEKEEVQVVVTAEQHDTVTIGEVLLSHRYDWNLNIMHGPRFSFEIEVPEGLVIRNVLGSNIKSWEVTTGHKMSRMGTPRGSDAGAAVSLAAAPESAVAESSEIVPEPAVVTSTSAGGEEAGGALASASSRRKDRRILRVYHQYGAEGNYQLSVLAETPLKDREGPISVLSCKMREVERETGFLAIEAPSNVEVNEKVISQLSRIDIQELPHFIRNRATTSILYAYKFVTAVWSASMDIKRHKDMDVLVAVIDEAWICSTMVREGKVQTKLELKVRNTTRQYLRIQLPQGAKIWSSEVNNNLVKPAFDVNGESVMIPLEKSTGHSQGKDSFWVDIVYMYEAHEMKGRGEVEMTLPSFDLPANQLFVELFMPKDFKYAEFEGDLKEVKYFTKSKDRPEFYDDGTLGYGSAIAAAGGPGSNAYESEAAPERFRAIAKSAPMRKMAAPAYGVSQMAVHAAGTKPVRVMLVRSGEQFRFERLLTDQEQFKLKVAFGEIYEPWWKKRRLGWWFW